MLSKSQARAFFLIGTALFSALFLGLTVDSLRQTGERTRGQNLSEEVKRGKAIWDQNNCMGCHTILGEGAYYAPDLTTSYRKRGPEWLRVFLQDPEAMFPGERKMVQYHFSEQQIGDVIAFLKWIGEVDTNGWPPEPDIAAANSQPVIARTAVDLSKAPEKFGQLCTACHSLGGQGGNVGPALDGVGARRDLAYLDRWLSDPQSVKPGTAMPKLPLSDAERAALVAFLATLK
ncbi:MAG: c-type cytochrome [Leptospirales bacterium]|nr:c-type cytochrome [Leptospirales bacterium]